MHIPTLVLLLAFAATYRLTMLVTKDNLTAGSRELALTRITGHGVADAETYGDGRCTCGAGTFHPDELARHIEDRRAELTGWRCKVSYLVTCPWCVSMYVAAPVTWSAWCFGTRAWWAIPAATLAGSAVTGTWSRYARPAT